MRVNVRPLRVYTRRRGKDVTCDKGEFAEENNRLGSTCQHDTTGRKMKD